MDGDASNTSDSYLRHKKCPYRIDPVRAELTPLNVKLREPRGVISVRLDKL